MEVDNLIESDIIDSTSLPFDFLDSLNLSGDVKRRLSNYLRSIVKGSDSVYISPIGDTYTPEKLLLEWDEIFYSNRHKVNDVLFDLEMSNRSKFGPRSIAKSWDKRKEGLLDYFKVKSSDIKIPTELFPTRGILRPVGFDKAISTLKNNTNSGLPYFLRKGSVKGKILSMSRDEFLAKVRERYPCILFTRTQEGDKTRDVWGYPIFVTIYEMQYYLPVLSHQKKLSWRSALISPSEVDRKITEMLFRCKSDPSLRLVSIDFSAFDRSVSPELIASAFTYIKALFQTEFSSDLDEICELFSTIGIVTPDGIFSGRHGVPSGSTFTNEVDSIVQYLVAMSSGFVIDDAFSIQGDDGSYLIHSDHLENFLSNFASAGLLVNDKTYISNLYSIYLQCLYHIDYIGSNGIVGGIYPTYRALNRIIYQERFVNFLDQEVEGRDYYSIRTISILENCKFHPLFEELVKFVLSRDKYALEFSEASLKKYINIVKDGAGTGGLLNNQYGDDLSGIHNFEVMKLLRRLR